MTKSKQLADTGEDALVRALTKNLRSGKGVVLGAGDDCALVRGARTGFYQLLKADCVVERVHFAPEAPPAMVGWKAMARSLSDVAAMGGMPQHAVVTVVYPPETELATVKAVYRGLEKAAARFGVSIVGGETSRTVAGAPAMISVALTGEVEVARCVRRSGGKSGDFLYVTGTLGGAVTRGRHLRFIPRIAEARWLTANFKLHAMMDLSDGLAKDLPRLASASGAGFEVDPASLPRRRGCTIEEAAGDGEDYELLFAIRPRQASALEERWARRFSGVRLTRIGRFTRDRGTAIGLSRGGWEHF